MYISADVFLDNVAVTKDNLVQSQTALIESIGRPKRGAGDVRSELKNVSRPR